MSPAQVAHIMELVDKLISTAWAGYKGGFDDMHNARAAVEAALRDTPQAEGWVKAVQSFADELGLPFLEAKSFLDEVFPRWMVDKEAAGFITLRRDDLIEGDSYGVDGSDFYRCRICRSESGAGMLDNGIKHERDCPLAATPSAPTAVEPTAEQSSVVEPNERAEFEAWAGPITALAKENGKYVEVMTSLAWEAWQARASKGTPL